MTPHIAQLAFAALLLTACVPPAPATFSAPAAAPAARCASVEGKADPRCTPGDLAPPYRREAFGSGWVIVAGRCDTREIVLERDAGTAAVDTDGDGCRDDGPIRDVYTGNTINPRQAHVDHVFSLKQAWAAGAWKWSPERRRMFSQDQNNLMVTLAAVNQSKGNDSPSEWRPPNQSGWCRYASTFSDTAQQWGLTVALDDYVALNDMLRTCQVEC